MCSRVLIKMLIDYMNGKMKIPCKVSSSLLLDSVDCRTQAFVQFWWFMENSCEDLLLMIKFKILDPKQTSIKMN